MEKKSKSNGLFYVILGFMLVYSILTYFIPAGEFGVLEDLTKSEVGIFRLLGVIFEAFGGFSSIVIFILLVGSFYGILKKTGVYNKLINSIASKFSKHEKIFMIAVMVLIAVISSVCGLEMGMFFLFPFVISIIVTMGYDKLTALACTFGATIVGMFGATFAGILYNVNIGLVNNASGSSITVKDEIYLKLLLLVVGLVALGFFTLMHAKKTVNDEVVNEEEKSSKKTWPILLIGGLVLLVFILGTTDFAAIFGKNWFTDINNSFTTFTIGDYAVFDKIFGGYDAFGTWFTPTRFEFFSLTLIVACALLMLIYKIKFSEGMDAFLEGARKYFKPAILTVLASSVFVLVFYYPLYKTIATYLMTLTKEFNIGIGALYSLLGGVFYVDPYYYTYYALPYLVTAADDVAISGLLSTMFASMYSLAMLVAPTGVMLLTSLSSNDVKYSSWIKYIWKLFVSLLIFALVIVFAYFAFINAAFNPITAQLILVGIVVGLFLLAVVIYYAIKIVKAKNNGSNNATSNKTKSVQPKKVTSDNKRNSDKSESDKKHNKKNNKK